MSVLIALSALIGPGFAQGLIGRRRAMIVVAIAQSIAFALMALTPWAVIGVLAVIAGAMVHAGWQHLRLGRKIRYRWIEPLIAFGYGIVLSLGLRTFVVEAFKIPASSGYPNLQIGDHVFVNKLARTPARGDLIVFVQPCERRDFVKRVIALAGDTLEVRCDVVFLNGQALPHELVNATDTYEDDHDGTSYPVEVSRYRETLDGKTYDIFQAPDRDPLGGLDDFPEAIAPTCSHPKPPTPPRDAPNQLPGTIERTANDAQPCQPFRRYVVPEGHVFVLGDNRANSADSRVWGPVPGENIHGRLTGIWLPLKRFGGVE